MFEVYGSLGRVEGLGFRVEGLGFRGFGFWGSGLGLGFRVSGFRAFGFGALGLEGLGFSTHMASAKLCKPLHQVPATPAWLRDICRLRDS